MNHVDLVTVFFLLRTSSVEVFSESSFNSRPIRVKLLNIKKEILINVRAIQSQARYFAMRHGVPFNYSVSYPGIRYTWGKKHKICMTVFAGNIFACSPPLCLLLLLTHIMFRLPVAWRRFWRVGRPFTQAIRHFHGKVVRQILEDEGSCFDGSRHRWVNQLIKCKRYLFQSLSSEICLLPTCNDITFSMKFLNFIYGAQSLNLTNETCRIHST